MPGIDVLRGLAILAVISFHGLYYSDPGFTAPNSFTQVIYRLSGWGWLGVNLFFVLSGFLITGILHDTQDYEDYYRRFYLRRALRILPVYFATLLLCWATGFVTLNYVAICVFFLANMPGLILRGGYVGYGPLWSLAVEEQFYLIWPFLYRRLKRRGMLYVSLSLMILCPILRGLASLHLIHTGEPSSKTWMIADNLVIGAILAILARSPGVSLAQFRRLGWIQFFVGFAGTLLLWMTHHQGREDVWAASLGTSCFILIFSSMVVMVLCLYRERRLQRWLGVFVFFGNISYGLYLIHMLCLQIYDRIEGEGFKDDWRKMLLRLFLANGVAIAVATLSRHYFESPILRMKDRLGTANRRPPTLQESCDAETDSPAFHPPPTITS